MKEIGLKLKKKREEDGLTIEEVADDLKMRPSQIASLEDGNREEFSDVVTLKYFIRDYAKYLGLNEEKILDEFNEFLFDFTSKIPVDDIEKAKGKDGNKKSITSPYTKVKKDNKGIRIILCIIAFCILVIIGYLIVSGINGNDFQDDNATYIIRR